MTTLDWTVNAATVYSVMTFQTVDVDQAWRIGGRDGQPNTRSDDRLALRIPDT